MAAPEIRIVDGDEKEAARRVVAMGFGGDPDGPDADEEREGWARMVSHAALVDGEVVGHTGAFDFTMTVPGSSARVAGVTNVGVSASARRRGVGSALLRTQLADSQQAGFVAAALWASEPRIYGRHGYGVASDLLALTIPRDRAALRVVEGVDAVRLRFVGLEEGRAAVANLQHQECVERPGLFPWGERWVRRMVRDDPDTREGASPLRILVADQGGDPTGYAVWRNEHVWGGGGPCLYLGGRSARTLARAGLAHAADDAALQRFDTAMRWDPAPHSDAIF